jgi:hypothetical protein
MTAMEIVELGESVQVGAVFAESGRLRPVWFAWRGRRMAVEKVNYAWQERDGGVRIYHFAVQVGGTVFEIAFDSSRFTWRILRSYLE